MKSGAISFNGNADAAFAKFVATRAAWCTSRMCPGFPLSRGRTCRRQHAGKLLRGKSCRNADDGAENSRLPQPVPEWRSAAQAFDLRLAQRQRVLANLQVRFGSVICAEERNGR